MTRATKIALGTIGGLSLLGVGIGASLMFNRQIQRDHWRESWSRAYSQWSTSMNTVKELAKLDRSSTKAANSLKLVKKYEEECMSCIKGEETFKFCKAVSEMKNHSHVVLTMLENSAKDTDYLNRQGLSEAFNVSLMSMGIDAVCAKNNNQEFKKMELDNFGAILIMLLFADDTRHAKLLKGFWTNRDAYPERDADEMFASAYGYLKNNDFPENAIGRVFEHVYGSKDIYEVK
jgi:hypothetical protein